MLRVIVLAPSAALRERLRTLARASEQEARGAFAQDVEIGGETADATRAHILATEADVLIVWGAPLVAQIASQLDPDHEDRAGAATFDRDVPSYAIVAIANDRRVTATLEALPVRGWAVLDEDATESEMTAAIAAADAGLAIMPVAWVARPRDPAVDWSDAAIADERLTGREQEVLEWLSQGLSNRRIAERLGISEHTVKFHITAIYGKLGASTRTEAVNRALRRGWLRI